jgi:hypothetical protein
VRGLRDSQHVWVAQLNPEAAEVLRAWPHPGERSKLPASECADIWYAYLESCVKYNKEKGFKETKLTGYAR